VLRLRLILGGAILAALLAGGWYVTHLIKTSAWQETEIDRLEQEKAALLDQRDTLRRARETRDADYREAERANDVLGGLLQEALKHETETTPCLAQPVSPTVDQRLRAVFTADRVPDSGRLNDATHPLP
jgi:hypothetical protein